MTASCLSTLSEFESLLGAWKIDALDLEPSGGLVSLSSTPSYMRPSRFILDPSQIWAFLACLAEKLTKNENSKFKFKRVPARQRKQGLLVNCKIALSCDTLTTLTPRILIALRNYEQICKFNWMTKVRGEQLGRLQMTWASASLTSHLSISNQLAELFELLVHKLGSPKCVVVGISVCCNIYFIKELPNEEKRIFLIPPPITTAP